jgi:hypothetical protein
MSCESLRRQFLYFNSFLHLNALKKSRSTSTLAPMKSLDSNPSSSPFSQNQQKPLVHFSKLKVNILKAIRNNHSQKVWSEKLGFKFNQSLKWETHQKKFTWTDFCFQCELAQLHLAELLTRYFNISLDNYSGLFMINKIITLYYPGQSIETLSQSLQIHPSALRRLIHGQSDTDFEMILKLLHIQSQVLGEFLKDLIPNSELVFRDNSELLAYALHLENARHAETHLPYLSAIQASLRLKSYKNLTKHADEFISERTGIPKELVAKSLPILYENKIIHYNASTSKYECLQNRIDMDGHPTSEILKLASFWTKRALQRINKEDGTSIRKKNTPNFLGYRIAPTSLVAQNKINDLLIQTNQKILKIIENDTNPPDDIRILMIHHFSSEDY